VLYGRRCNLCLLRQIFTCNRISKSIPKNSNSIIRKKWRVDLGKVVRLFLYKMHAKNCGNISETFLHSCGNFCEKSFIVALAALASVSAFAQSSVTIDGVIELGMVNPIGAEKARLDAANGGTQIRFRGTEDLGGGMKANFVLAQRLSPESGNNDGSANGRPTFQGESTVGLSGGFGAVKIGRSLTPFQVGVNGTDPWGTLQQASTAVLPYGYATSPTAAGGATGILNHGGAGRTDHVNYSSPSFGGLTVNLGYGLKNSAESGAVVESAKAMTSLWVAYANGPLSAGAGTEQNRFGDKATAVLAKYDLGVAAVGAGFGTVNPSNTTNDYKTWNVMATMPVGAVTLKFGYGQAKADNAAAATKKTGIGADYALSKRTLIVTSYGRDAAKTADKTGFDIGIRHSF